MSRALETLHTADEVHVVQKKELAELFGFETRNKYAIEVNGVALAYAAEQGKGLLEVFARFFLGHWRRFEIHVFDSARELLFRAVHPFRFFFQELEVVTPEGQVVGSLVQRFAVFSKRFDVLGAEGQLLLTVNSPLWRPWTFAFERHGSEVARIEKKWSGTLREIFTDADRFRILFSSPELSTAERLLILGAALFVDIQYFEAKAD